MHLEKEGPAIEAASEGIRRDLREEILVVVVVVAVDIARLHGIHRSKHLSQHRVLLLNFTKRANT